MVSYYCQLRSAMFRWKELLALLLPSQLSTRPRASLHQEALLQYRDTASSQSCTRLCYSVRSNAVATLVCIKTLLQLFLRLS